ncbi:hypothetical protein [Microbacterium soli]|uniref:Tetratricopeptide repeat protein n=1 Tax=Microbacterium soli TaxID=446075 RepID=A0ABP7MLG5_9MICO
MTTRISVALMGAALLLYVLIAGYFAVLFFTTGTLISVCMGIALIALAVIGGWALVREMQFGLSADRLGRLLDAEGGMPEAPADLTPSGRLRPEDVEPFLRRYTDAADAAPADWKARYRLGVVQDSAGRRKDARASIRTAIGLAREHS